MAFGGYNYTNKGDISFPQIILKQFERVLEKASHEFTGGYHNSIFSGNNVEKVYVADARAEFSQSVKLLGLSLFPYFDDKMTKSRAKFEEKDEEVKKTYSKEGFLDEKGKYSVKSLELSLGIFKEISKLLQRKNYLKTQSYIEEIKELEEEEDDF